MTAYSKISLTGVLLFFVVLQVMGQDAENIIRKMEERMRGTSSYIEMTMTTVRPRYTREISMKAWAKGDDLSLILITSPARDKGIAYLKRYKEIWNYVPSIDRQIKMPPSMMSQSWMGSDFSNDDLVRESSTINDYTHRLLPPEVINGMDCYVIELKPRPESSIVYEKVKIWVSKDKYIQLRIENYDEFDEVVNLIEMSEIKLLGGREIPTRIELTPMDRKGNKTIITYQDAKFNIPMDDNFFTVQNLRNIR